MRFTHFKLEFNKNGFFYGTVKTDQKGHPNQSDYNQFNFKVMNNGAKFDTFQMYGFDSDGEDHLYKWDPGKNKFELIKVESRDIGFDKDINLKESRLVDNLSEESVNDFYKKMQKLYKIIMKEIDRNVIRNLRDATHDFDKTIEFQKILKEAYEGESGAFDIQQKALIKSLFENEIPIDDIRFVANPEYNYNQMLQVYFGVLGDMPRESVEVYADPKFSEEQMKELYRALFYGGIPRETVKVFADVCFTPEQMAEIVMGFNLGLSTREVGIYAKPQITVEQMQTIRMGYGLGLSADDMSSIPLVAPNVMSTVIENVARDLDKSKFLSAENEYLGIMRNCKDGLCMDNLKDLSVEAQFEIWRILQREREKVTTIEGSLEEVLNNISNDAKERCL